MEIINTFVYCLHIERFSDFSKKYTDLFTGEFQLKLLGIQYLFIYFDIMDFFGHASNMLICYSANCYFANVFMIFSEYDTSILITKIMLKHHFF